MRTIKYVGHNGIFDAIVLTVLSSNVESLKKGVIIASKNKAKAPYTTLLAGQIGVGKTLVLYLIASVFAGNDMHHYNFDINSLDHPNERGGSNCKSQTNSAQFTNSRARTT